MAVKSISFRFCLMSSDAIVKSMQNTDKSGRHTFSTFGTSHLSSSPPQNRQDLGVQECQLRCHL